MDWNDTPDAGNDVRLVIVFTFRFQFGYNVEVQLFGIVVEQVSFDLQLRDKINEGIDTAFDLQEFIEHDYFLLLENTIATLKRTSFIPQHVASLFRYGL
jgi:hypothetical protein